MQLENARQVIIHPMVDDASQDYAALVECAAFFAGEGSFVKILPRLHPKSDDYLILFGDLKGTRYENKSPDLRIGGFYYEFESFIAASKATASRI